MDDKAKYRLCETADCTIITGIEDIEIPVYIASSEKCAMRKTARCPVCVERLRSWGVGIKQAKAEGVRLLKPFQKHRLI